MSKLKGLASISVEESEPDIGLCRISWLFGGHKELARPHR
jgi:hypothetical protein